MSHRFAHIDFSAAVVFSGKDADAMAQTIKQGPSTEALSKLAAAVARGQAVSTTASAHSLFSDANR